MPEWLACRVAKWMCRDCPEDVELVKVWGCDADGNPISDDLADIIPPPPPLDGDEICALLQGNCDLYNLVNGANTTIVGDGSAASPWQVNANVGNPVTLELCGEASVSYGRPVLEEDTPESSLQDIVTNTVLNFDLPYEACVHLTYKVGQLPNIFGNLDGTDVHVGISVDGSPVIAGLHDRDVQYNRFSASSGTGSVVVCLPAGAHSASLYLINDTVILDSQAIADAGWIQAFWTRKNIFVRQ